MNAEESTENPISTAEPQPAGNAGAERQEPRRHRGGRRGRFRRGGRGGGRDNRPERTDRVEGENRGDQAAPAAEEGRKPVSSSIRKAIDQVLHVRAELRRVLDEIQEILRTLEQAEREKTASEDEIEMLRESLRGLHREPGYPRHRGSAAPRPAPAPAATHEEAETSDEEEEPEAEQETEAED